MPAYEMRISDWSSDVCSSDLNARSVAFVGAGFIGLEAAGALHARGLGVHVVAPDEVPMARALGPGIGGFLAGLNREQGGVFHLRATAKGRLEERRVGKECVSTGKSRGAPVH